MTARAVYRGVRNIEEAVDKISHARFRDAQQSSRNVLDSVLGGIEIGRRQTEQNEDLKAVLEYLYCDDREVEDFETQLEEGAVEAMPDVDPKEWTKQLTRWEEASVGGTEKDEALEWLALNGTHHVYCSAARLALSNRVTEE